MDPITIATLGIGTLLVAAIIIYRNFQKKNNELKAAIAALETYSQTYAFETCDEEIIKKVSNYLQNKFGGNYEEIFDNYKSLEEKKAFFQKIALELAAEMQVEIGNLSIESTEPGVLGATTGNGKDVIINEVLLIADPKQAICTLCHEFRHCMQYQAIFDNKWGFSDQRIAEWIYSFKRYNECRGLFLAYANTIVEIDAENFANTVINN